MAVSETAANRQLGTDQYDNLDPRLTPVPMTASSNQDPSDRHDDVLILSWDGPHDSTNPLNWPLRKKWSAIGIGLVASAVCAVNGTILSVAFEQINDDFGISDTEFPNSYWPTTSWGVGGAIFSFILFPLLEDFGVRPVFLGTYFFLICFLIPIGLAKNFATLIVARFFSGGCVQLVCNAVAGVISNVFDDNRSRSIPLSLYVTVYFVATSIGPVIGAVILQNLSWRWIGYLELIWTAAFSILFVFWMPESRGAIILQAKAKRVRREGKHIHTEEELRHIPWHKLLVKGIYRPLYMLVTEPVVFIASLWAAFGLGITYLFTQSVQQVFGSLYGWNPEQAGYVQTAIAVGEFLGCGLCWWSNSWYYNSAIRNTEAPGTPIPEARLYGAIIGGAAIAGGMLLYGWTSYPTIPWIAPAIGLGLVGFGTTATIVADVNYLIDAYSEYAASALGAVCLLENLSLGLLPLASTSLYTNLGFQWASSLLAFVSFGLVIAPFAMLRWGKQIRSRSVFMKEVVREQRADVTTDTDARFQDSQV